MAVIDHQQFIARLDAEFPGTLAAMDDCGRGLLHVEMADFRRATEAAMDAGLLWLAEKHFRFVEALLPDADPDVKNAIEVSYLEDLALGGCTPARYRAVKERMPKALREVMVGHHSNWR